MSFPTLDLFAGPGGWDEGIRDLNGGMAAKRFEQVGNAVPPPLARAVIAALLELPPGPAAEAVGPADATGPGGRVAA